MAESKKLVIFCSASNDIDPKYGEAARELTRSACSLGYTVVSGGTVKGTMGVVADEVVACGGRHVGVIPGFMKEYLHPGLSEVAWTDTMAQRKEKMREGASVAVALPGGIGTLDELVETLTLAKLNRFPGKILALDLDGFYAPLIALLDHYVALGMLDPASRGLIEFPPTVGELVAKL